MKSETTISSSGEGWDSGEVLSLPHFDDEITLSSARQVVPLREVKSRGIWSHLWRLSLATSSAAVIGAFTAILIVTQRKPTANDTWRVSDTTPAFEQSSQATDAGGIIESNNAALQTAAKNETSEIDREFQAAVPRKQAASSTEVKSSPSSVAKSDDLGAQQNEIEMRREERREARRRMRQAERQARRRTDDSDDLFRIREIFEGSPRPE